MRGLEASSSVGPSVTQPPGDPQMTSQNEGPRSELSLTTSSQVILRGKPQKAEFLYVKGRLGTRTIPSKPA